jgi:hypothetical protein
VANAVAIPFTASLLSHRNPPVKRVVVPQRCLPHSLCTSHRGQWKRPCSPPPIVESTSIPAKPISVPASASDGTPAAQAPVSETSAAPRIAPQAPAVVTPPLVPGTTFCPVQSRRGGTGLSDPTDVAQVSAAAAARLAVTSQILRAKSLGAMTAASAAAPPFANTCQASRRLSLRSNSGANRLAVSFDIRLLETKKTARTAPPCHPAPTSIRTPMIHAARAPPKERAPTCHAMPDTPALTNAASGNDGEVRSALPLPAAFPRFAPVACPDRSLGPRESPAL